MSWAYIAATLLLWPHAGICDSYGSTVLEEAPGLEAAVQPNGYETSRCSGRAMQAIGDHSPSEDVVGVGSRQLFGTVANTTPNCVDIKVGGLMNLDRGTGDNYRQDPQFREALLVKPPKLGGEYDRDLVTQQFIEHDTCHTRRCTGGAGTQLSAVGKQIGTELVNDGIHELMSPH